ncbi:MAG TPA: hypothetical protein VGI40_00935 [Pirellulaceae bacterium]|jgi:hypothetical protein
MDARFLRCALVLAIAVLSAGAGRPYASVRSQHFIVTAPSQQLATEICQAAEQFRRDLAIEWLGHELPEWNGVCPIKADVAQNLGAGGATSFVFQGGAPGQWTMSIQGSRERILDSVLPHEITHTIFATHFGRPLPRWADEGACTTVEDESEKAKQDKFLVQFLTSDRGIPFNRMFQMKDYPPDILPLYSQGYSLARFFIQQGGKQKYVQYVGEGMRSNNWTATTQQFYGFKSLSDLQLTWVEWVRSGSRPLQDGRVPETLLVAAGIAPASAPTSDQPPRNALASNMVANTQMASLTQLPQSRIPGGARESWQTVQQQNDRVFNSLDPNSIPAAPASYARPARAVGNALRGVPSDTGTDADFSSVSRPVSDGWYSKRRDQAQNSMTNRVNDSISDAPTTQPQQTTADLSEPVPPLPPQRNIIEAQPLTPVRPAANQTTAASGSAGRVLLEWTRPETEPTRASNEVLGVALNDRGTTIR